MRHSKKYFILFAATAIACWAGGIRQVRGEDAVSSEHKLDTKYFVGSWIWTDLTKDKQTCHFWRRIDIPRDAAVTGAKFRITVDNSYRVYFDGRQFGQGSEWQSLSEYDLSLVMTPGSHILAVDAFNEYAEAGLLAGLRIELLDGGVIEIPSDSEWRIAPENRRDWTMEKRPGNDWPQAKVIAGFLATKPWNKKPIRILYGGPMQQLELKFWQTGWFQITLLSACAVTLVICVRLIGKLALQSKAQELLQRERARIARDIHDDMGAGLMELVLFGEVAQAELPDSAEMGAKFNRVSEKSRALLSSIDEIVWMVNSQRDTLRDFETYVSRYAEQFLRSTQIRCRLDADAEIPDGAFDLATRRNLFLAIKEALNNAVKHSEATEIHVKLHVSDKNVVVVVEDNGKGFDPATGDSCRNGLANMKRRTVEVGGSCKVTSQPGTGCRVELTAPLAPRAGEKERWWQARRERGATSS